MPEIGETLRETRMRRRIDMTEVEAATKIRAKYLRALENEEWDLLPGPTFVKTFLRTYAEYLDLDPRLLVEEYRQRYERPSTQDLTPFGPGLGGRGQRGRRRPRRPIGPFVVIGFGLLVLLAALYALGVWWPANDDEGNRAGGTPTATATATATATPSSSKKKSSRRKKPVPTRVTLRLTATNRVYVCVEDASGKPVVGGGFLEKGQHTKTFRSKLFRANFGNGSVRLTVDGKPYHVANTGRPVGYEMKPGKKPRRLSESVRAGLCAL
jgi:transcriptional regulator with XRE-family HTH domain